MIRNWSMRAKLIIIIILALSSMAFVFLYKENQMRGNKEIEWGATISVADYTLYKENNFRNIVNIQKSDKVRNYSTSFYLNDGTWLRSLHSGSGFWGYGSRPLGGNILEQPLPDKIRVTYLDETTNQYYQGEHSLPTKKIYELMTSTNKNMESERSISLGLNSNYYNIDLAFAPDGWVIVFVTGWPGRQEVTSFQATSIEPNPKTIEGEPVSSGDEMLYIDYESYLEAKNKGPNYIFMKLKNSHPKAYEKWQSGEWSISSNWYKKIQTKYPWNLSISIDGQEWNGEYYAEFANTEKFAVLDDQFDQYNNLLKAVPTKIKTWATDIESGERTEVEVHLYPRPQWAARGTGSASYRIYYQDPNLNYFFKNFENLYPKYSLATNNQHVNQDEFATLRLKFDKNLVLIETFLQKGEQKIPIEGAYQFSRAPIDPEQGKYFAKKNYPQFITKPNIKTLSDPAFVDMD